MRIKKLNIKKLKIKKSNLFLLIIFICTCLTSIGYSAITSTLNVSGIAAVRINNGIRITNLKVESSYGDAYEEYNSEFSRDTTSLNTALPASNSYLIYEVTISNYTNDAYILKKITPIIDSNSQITYEILDLFEGDVIVGNSVDTLRIKVYNNNGLASDTTENLKLKYEFEKYEGIDTTTISKYITNLYNISSKTRVTAIASSSNTAEHFKYGYASSNKLMKDNNNNIRYYGATPNNYIYYNCIDYNEPSSSTCELWRIVGVFDGKIKIVRNDSIGNYIFDDSDVSVNIGFGISEWSQADIMQLLNPGYESNGTNGSFYYTSGSGNCYTANDRSAACDFTDTGLKNMTTKNLIADTTWYTGGHDSNDIYPNEIYTYERGSKTGTSSGGVTRYTSWDGKVALLYPSDYGYAADLSLCTDKLSGYNSSSCKNNNWLSNKMAVSSTSYFITPQSGTAGAAWSVASTGSVSYNRGVYNSGAIFPTVYLNADTELGGGIGTSDNPYFISTDQQYYTFTVNPVPSDALVTIKSGNTILASGIGRQSVTTVDGKTLTYTLTRTDYYDASGSYKMGAADHTTTVEMEDSTWINGSIVNINNQVAATYTSSNRHAGYYLIELWGGKGGDGAEKNGGTAGYVYGVVYIPEGAIVFATAGGNGIDKTNNAPGGANGGGESASDTWSKGGSGGGYSAFVVGTTSITLANVQNSNVKLIAGAGAGSSGRSGATGIVAGSGQGGNGGTLTSASAAVTGGTAFSGTDGTYNKTKGQGYAGFTTGGTSNGEGKTGTFLTGGDGHGRGGGGGAGYYGGGGGSGYNSGLSSSTNFGPGGGGGGSSFIATGVAYTGLSSAVTSKLRGTNPSATGGAVIITYVGTSY